MDDTGNSEKTRLLMMVLIIMKGLSFIYNDESDDEMKSFYPSPKILILQKLNNKCAMTEQQKRLCENDN